jgi:uncharacterized protein (TIGR02466 family)
MAKTIKSSRAFKQQSSSKNEDVNVSACPVNDQKKQDVLEQLFYFPTVIYTIMKPEFLDVVNEVSEESLKQVRKETSLHEIYPVYMSDNYFLDPRIQQFSTYVGSTAWNILVGQGYAMNNLVVQFTEMWTQEHYKHSLMEQHAHGYGSQIVGFYFLETPENCSRIIFHDPRPGKTLINLPEIDQYQATYGSNMINLDPKPGMLVFSNSWLPHSFSRHGSDEPIKFVHFNLTVGHDFINQQNTLLNNDPSTPIGKPAEVI